MRTGSAAAALRPTPLILLLLLLAAPPGAAQAGAQDAPAAQATPRAVPAGDLIVNLDDLGRPLLIENQLVPLAGVPDEELRVSVPGGQARLGHVSLGSEQELRGHLLVLRGGVDVYGTLRGNLVTVDGDVTVHPGAVVAGDILALRGTVRDLGGEVSGEMHSLSAPRPADGARAADAAVGTRIARALAGIAGALVCLLVLGATLAFFGAGNLTVVSDTITHSFGRAFVTGVLGQLLLIPTFAIVVVGLVLSVVGVLLLPFAVIVYALLAVLGIVGGTLAAAHAMGETYTRRRLAQGERVPAGALRYLITGLVPAAGLWLAWALLGWVPVAGAVMLAAAVVVTWVMATVGFGAALLSRAGIRENFAGRILPPETLTDEYLWATPQFGVPAVRRPGVRTPPPIE